MSLGFSLLFAQNISHLLTLAMFPCLQSCWPLNGEAYISFAIVYLIILTELLAFILWQAEVAANTGVGNY